MTDHKNLDSIIDLIALKLADGTSDAESRQLEELILENEEVRALWEEMSASHQRPAAQLALKTANKQATWENIDFLTTPQKRTRPVVYSMALKVASAACIVLAIGIYTFWRFYSPDNTPKTDSAIAQLTLSNGEVIDLSQPKGTINIPNGPVVNNNNRSITYDVATNNTKGVNTLWSPAGSDYKILLSDGSEVWLNSMTTLRFPFQFTGTTREIYIDGEAFIKVAKNAEAPFIVHLPQGDDIHVLGTELNVNTYDQQRKAVALVSGSIRLQTKEESTIIKPGYQAVIAADASMKTAQFDSKEVLSWMEGIYLFNNATLAEIVKALPRWYGVEVVLDNPSTAQNRFTCYLDRKLPISVFLQEIKATADADYYFEGSVLHFR